MKFNSQICTTREQSERLLALGLKRETADCCWHPLVEKLYTLPPSMIETTMGNLELIPA